MDFDWLESNVARVPGKAKNAERGLLSGRQEHTVGGCLIGVVRDLMSFGSSGPGDSRLDRAGANDKIAEIAADTAAFLPSFKWVGAGILRATLLANPNGGVKGNVLGLGKNFLEGAALNKVGKLAAPEGFLAKRLTASLGEGLATQSLSHLSVGFGMGAVKTGFNANAWKDSTGQLSVSTGIENIFKSGAVGAVVNVPAGLVATGIGRAATVGVAEGNLSRTTAGLLSGWGAGYASGSVFGAIDAISAGKNWKEVLSSMNDSGLVGGVTGAFVHNYETRRAPLVVGEAQRAGARPAAAKEQTHEQELAGSIQKRGEVEGKSKPFERWYEVSDAEFAKMDITPATAQRVEQLASRMRYGTAVEHVEVEKRTQREKFKDFDDFARAGLKSESTTMRLYQIDGLPTTIAVPETYAQHLDRVRNLRIISEQKLGANSTREEITRVGEAKQALQKDPYGTRALPEEFIPYIEALPERSLIQRLVLLDHVNPQDRWFKSLYNDGNFVSSASASESGVITFYKADRPRPGAEWVRRVETGHEWAHLLKYNLELESRLFDLAASLESEARGGYFSRDYAKKKPSTEKPHEENWAVHLGEEMLGTDADSFMVTAEQMPVRASIFARAMIHALGRVPANQRSPYHGQYAERVNFVERNILPKAQEQLAQHLNGSDPEAQALAAKLLGYLGDKRHVKRLSELAIESPDVGISQSSFLSAVRLSGAGGEKVSMLLEMAHPTSRVRKLALETLERVSPPYAEFASLRGDASAAGRMLKLYDRMPDRNGKLMVVDEALKMAVRARSLQPMVDMTRMGGLPLETRESAFHAAMGVLSTRPDQQVAFALNTLVMQPELRVSALTFLKKYPEPKIAERVARFTQDSNPEVAVAAVEFMISVELQTTLARLTSKLDIGLPGGKLEAARQLGDLHDLRAIRPLLKAGVIGDQALKEEVRLALGKYTFNLVKFEAQQMSRETPQFGSGLRELVYSQLRL